MKPRLMLIITLVILILAIGGIAAWWFLLGPGGSGQVQGVAATPTETKPAATETAKPTATVKPTSTPEPEPEQVTEGMEGCITIRVLNVRIGPGLDYPAAGGLGKGECVQFDARSADNQWLRVYGRVAERGDRLWASAYYVTLNGDVNDLPVPNE